MVDVMWVKRERVAGKGTQQQGLGHMETAWKLSGSLNRCYPLGLGKAGSYGINTAPRAERGWGRESLLNYLFSSLASLLLSPFCQFLRGLIKGEIDSSP